MAIRNAFANLNQLIVTAGEHVLTGTPEASATKALLRIGSAISGGDADGTYLGINAAAAYAGAFADFQTNGSRKFLVDTNGFVGIGGAVPNAGRPIAALVNLDASFAARFENLSEGTGAAFGFFPVVGTTSVASGAFQAWSINHATTELAGRIGIQASTANATTGIVMAAQGATQNFTWVNSVGNIMRLTSAGELTLLASPVASATKSLFSMGTALVSGNAAGTFLGINAPSGYTGDQLRVQRNGANELRLDDGGRLILGERATPLFKLEVAGTGDDTTSSSILTLNTNTGSSAAALLNMQCGTGGGNVSSGFIGIFNQANGSHAGQMGMFTNSNALGITLRANVSGQMIQFWAGGLNEQMRLSAAGELLIGTTSSIARLGVVGRADQNQFRITANGTQTTDLMLLEESGGADRWLIESGYGIRHASTSGAVLTGLTGSFYSIGNINDSTTCTMTVENDNNGTTASARFNLFSATSSGYVGMFPANYTATSAYADRMVIALNSTASGLVFGCDGATQDIRALVGGLGEQLRLTATGELLVGATSATGLGRLAVVGRADQVQCAVRGFSTQTTNLQEWQTSAPATVASLSNSGTLTLSGSMASSSLSTSATTGGNNRFGGTATAGSMLTIVTALTGNVGLVIRGIAAQTGTLIDLYQQSSAQTRKVGGIDATYNVTTDASREGRILLIATDFNGDREILRGEASGTVARIGFLGATAIVRPSSTTDLRAALINLGLYTTGGATPLDLNGGILTSAAHTIVGVSDTIQLVTRAFSTQTTNIQEWQTSVPATVMSITNAGRLEITGALRTGTGTGSGPSHTFTGDTDTGMYNPGANLLSFATSGFERLRIATTGDLELRRESTTQTRKVAGIVGGFVSSTDASYTGRLTLIATDVSGDRTVLIGEADGAAPRLGVLGAAAIARPASYTLSGAATRTFPTDPSGAYTGQDNLQAGTVYAKVADLNTLRTAVSTLIGICKQHITDMGSTSGFGYLAHS